MMKLRLLQINCLDLFIFLDRPMEKDISEYSEEEWQSLTVSLRGNKILDRTKRLATSLLLSNADIICLNEVGGEESLINFNKYFLKNQYNVAMAPGSSNRGIDTGFLVRKGIQFEINGFKSMLIKGQPFFFSRTVNHLLIKDQNKSILNIFGCHLRSKRAGPNDPTTIEIRYNEVKGLTKIINNTFKSDPTPIALMGDFNGNAGLYNRDFEFDSIYEKTDLRDIHDLTASSEQERYSFVRFEQNDINYCQLDYIFLSKDLHNKITQVKRWLYRTNDQDVYVATMNEKIDQPSDHYPQMVEIII